MLIYPPRVRRIKINKRVRLNQEISSDKLRLIDSGNKQIGIVSKNEALDLAKLQGLDLVEISPSAKPPVAKIMDWGKYRYEQEKHQRKARKKQKNVEVKQIRLGLKTDSHDVDTKLRAARKFLEQGHKVKINLRFRGREITHPQLGQKVIVNALSSLEDIASKETEPTLSGNELSVVITRKKDAKTKN